MITRAFLILSCAIGLSGCMEQAMFATDPMGTLDLATGQGTVARNPTGETTFRFVIPENAHRFVGSVSDPRALDRQMLSQWIGKEGICPTGYTVNEPISASGMLIYEGACK